MEPASTRIKQEAADLAGRVGQANADHTPPKTRRVDCVEELYCKQGVPASALASASASAARAATAAAAARKKPVVPASTPIKRAAADLAVCVGHANADRTPPTKRSCVEELYCKQVRILEARLGELLPRLSLEQLSTAAVQAQLEDYMQKPRGRFELFRKDISRVWRSFFLERSLAASRAVPDLD